MSKRMTFKSKAREVWKDLPTDQGHEGFPDSSSFVYGFIEGSDWQQLHIDKLEKQLEITCKGLFKVQSVMDCRTYDHVLDWEIARHLNETAEALKKLKES